MASKLNKSLIKGSLILLITFNIFNVLNFFFQFAMARLLTPADYGILAALFSIIYIFGVFSEPIQTIITKYSAKERDTRKIKNIMLRSLRKSVKLSSFIFIIYLFASIPFSILLKIPYLLLSSTGIMIFASFLQPITRGVLQGKKRFNALGFNLIIEGISKICLAIMLVLIGFEVYGAMAATIIAALMAFLLSFFALKEILKSKEKLIRLPDIYSYSRPVFLALFSILAFYSLDIIIAKILFDETTAGFYAIASVLSKIIFIGTQPISKAMFPISAEDKSAKKGNILSNALFILLPCIFLILGIYYLFPELLVRIFAGREIPESASILFYLAVAASLIASTNLILLYKLSLGRIRNYVAFLIFPLIELILLSLFSKTLLEFSIAYVCAAAIFLFGVILLFDSKKYEK